MVRVIMEIEILGKEVIMVIVIETEVDLEEEKLNISSMGNLDIKKISVKVKQECTLIIRCIINQYKSQIKFN